MIKYTFFLMILLVLLGGCSKNRTNKLRSLKVIFDTDMGNDIDDALALVMLNNYVSEGMLDLIGIVSSKKNLYSIEYIDILDTWYSHPDIPVGITGENRGPEDPTYTKVVANFEADGKKIFKRSIKNYSKIPDAVDLYRMLLAKSKDTSVVIICVGFSTNLAGLLKSEPDNYSSLMGKDLIKEKVLYLSMMACNFDGVINHKEYNVIEDCEASRNVFEHWPTPIIISPFEVGLKVKYPASSIMHDFSNTKHHPLVEAYYSYMDMPYDRPSWDLTSVLYTVEKDSNYFSRSKRGTVIIDSACASRFIEEDDKDNCRYLKIDSSKVNRVLERLVDVVTMDEKE